MIQIIRKFAWYDGVVGLTLLVIGRCFISDGILKMVVTCLGLGMILISGIAVWIPPKLPVTGPKLPTIPEPKCLTIDEEVPSPEKLHKEQQLYDAEYYKKHGRSNPRRKI